MPVLFLSFFISFVFVLILLYNFSSGRAGMTLLTIFWISSDSIKLSVLAVCEVW